MKRILILITILPILVFSKDLTIVGFLNELSQQESKGSYYEIGGAGNKYFGKYQFSNIALREIDWGHITLAKFRANKSIFSPDSQEQAMKLLIKRYKYHLKNEINKYSKTYFKGKYVTTAGILAACHGCGYPEVKKYFKGTSSKPKTIEKYLKQFSEYYIS